MYHILSQYRFYFRYYILGGCTGHVSSSYSGRGGGTAGGGVLQCVAVCCSVLQCVAVCCSVLQCDESVMHLEVDSEY